MAEILSYVLVLFFLFVRCVPKEEYYDISVRSMNYEYWPCPPTTNVRPSTDDRRHTLEYFKWP